MKLLNEVRGFTLKSIETILRTMIFAKRETISPKLLLKTVKRLSL